MSDVIETLLTLAKPTADGPARGDSSLTPVEAYRHDFEARFGASSSEPAWLQDIRRDAMSQFEADGFPTMKNEDWHFTSVSPIGDRIFNPALPGAPVSAAVLARFSHGQDWHTFAFVNGRLVSGGGDVPSGVTVSGLADAIDNDDSLVQRHFGRLAGAESSAFTALNAAFARDGAVVLIDADAVIAKPIHLLFISDASAEGTVVHTRNLIFAGRHSECTVIESYVALGDDVYFTNAVTEAHVADGARLGHYKLQTESRNAFHVGTTQAHQARNSLYESFSFATGARLSRTNVYTALAGEAAEAVLNGLYMVDGVQHVDHQTRIEHVAPNCTSHELYKGVLDGRSHGVFNGKVYVHPEAQKTDGKQSNNNLLLSDQARIDTKPQLEIFADDVKCTHGATVGRLDETALFYMRSRGIGMSQARRLLTYAFAADVLEKIELEPLRESLEAQVLERFTA